MPTPSLLIVPARFKSGKLYSQIPTSGAGDFTVTRATSATRVNASGLIEIQKTNLALRSEEFNVSGTWIRSSAGTALLPVITANDAVSPDGNQTADKIDLSLNSGNTTADISWIYQNNTLNSGQIYAGSVWLKAATQADVGKVIQVGYVSYQSYTLTADWVRITLTQTPSSTGNYSFGFRLRGAQGTANSASFYAWGAQLEEGSSASEYIPTTTVARTRFAGVTVDGTVATNIPRLDYLASGGTVGCPALLVEPSGTNSIRNNSMNGAVTGTPGTLPTNWVRNTLAGLTQQVAGTGAENGIQYIDIRLSGTATSTALIEYRFDASTQIAAINSQSWTSSAYLRLISNTLPANSIGLAFYGRDAAGNALQSFIQTVSVTNTLLRYSTSGTTANASTAFVQPFLSLSVTNGQAYDFTIRIGYPQMELGSVATSVIPTTTAAVTRNADVVSVSGAVSGSIGQTQGTLYAEVDMRNITTGKNILSTDDGNTSNRVSLFVDPTPNRLAMIISNSGTSTTISGSITTGVHKIAVSYSSGDVQVFLNGGFLASGVPAAFPTVTRNNFSIGGRIFSGVYGAFFNDRIRAAALYTTRLTNAELAALTTP